MSSIFDEAAKAADKQLTRMRWALGLNGLLAIAFGVVILVWPDISLNALTILFGIYALASGIVAIVTAFSPLAAGARGWLVFSGLLGIAVGVIVLVWTDMSALALLYVIGAYAIGLGLLAIVGAFWLPLDGGDTALLALDGLIAIVFGVVMFAKPSTGALVLLTLIAAFALITGVSEIVVAIGGKRLVARSTRQAVPSRTHAPSV